MKDPRKHTLGELLDSTDTVIYRNAVSIHKRLKQIQADKEHTRKTGNEFLDSEFAKDIPEERKNLYRKYWNK